MPPTVAQQLQADLAENGNILTQACDRLDDARKNGSFQLAREIHHQMCRAREYCEQQRRALDRTRAQTA